MKQAYVYAMKTLLTAILSLMLMSPVFAGPRGGHEGHNRFEGHRDNDWHERHEGWRSFHGRFNGYIGSYYGQVIFLDDGCYFWNGVYWQIYYTCE